MIKKYKLFLESIIKTEDKNNFIKFVYIENGVEQGYLTCFYDYDNLSEFLPENKKGEIYIENVKSYIKGKEIGKKLIEAAIDEGKKLGLQIVTLKLPSMGANNAKLADYYKSLGFSQSWTEEESRQSGGTKNSEGYHLFI